jgi:NADPH:quinone reductase-like Zn-dependent oxidoreductase
MVAYDFPEPARHCAFITSTSVPKPVSNGYHLQQIEILNGLPAGHPGNCVCSTLHENLAAKNFQTTLRKWSDDEIDDLCSYVILDSADQPLLTRVSPEQFKHTTSLLTKASKVYWITLSDGTAGIVPNSGIITGLARSARSEIDNILFFTLDVQDSLDNQREQILSAVLDFITTTETKIATEQALEFEYMFKDGQLHIQRFVRDTKLNKAVSNNEEEHEAEEYPFYQPERALKAHVKKLGLLSSLAFVDDEIRAPTEDEVEVRPFAWGVNFKDVFIALGQMKSTQVMAGECAGVVTRVGTNFSSLFKAGDRVAVMTGTPYSSLTRTSGNFVHKIPDSISYADASSIPVAFATAYYGIVDCANLQNGDTILIHAASGGVGQAAIMIGQHIGATIFATVGSSAKRQLLMDKYSIPEAYIFSSRTTDFHAGVMRLTGGKGVDVVLNSLSEEALDASWKSVARLGTFVEIGKTDIYRRNNLSMEPFDRNVRFASVDLAIVAQARPKSIQDLLRRVFAYVESGQFQPLPTITFPIVSIEQAFRLIQARKHTGKVVLEAASDSIVKARIPPLRLRSDGTYVIVGGLGSLGRQLCRHLQICGARRIAIFSRRAFDDDARRNLEKELAGESDSHVKVLTCDIIDASQVFKAAEELHAVFPPVRGVIQAAMVIAVS